MPMDPKFYAYGRLLIVVTTIICVHGTYYYMYEHASKDTQRFWRMDGAKERALFEQKRLIVDRRRRVIKHLRKEYATERANFKVMFEDWADIHSPDTPFYTPYTATHM